MFKAGRKPGTMRFVYRPENGAGRVRLAGDFTGWNPVAMKPQKNGTFAVTLPLEPGTHEYRLIVDDEWMTDPDHSHWAPNAFGSYNSVVEVE